MLLRIYIVSGIFTALHILYGAYERALFEVTLFPRFNFWDTFHEELIHYTAYVPILGTPITSAMMLWTYAIGFAMFYRDLMGTIILNLLNGQLFSIIYYEYIQPWLPSFLFPEAGMPELVSDDEGHTNDNDNNGIINRYSHHVMETRTTINGKKNGQLKKSKEEIAKDQCLRKIEVLKQVKLQHKDVVIEKPANWLVFDPLSGKLVEERTLLNCASPSNRSTADSELSEEDNTDETIHKMTNTTTESIGNVSGNAAQNSTIPSLHLSPTNFNRREIDLLQYHGSTRQVESCH